MYVGFSRAKNFLCITYVNEPISFISIIQNSSKVKKILANEVFHFFIKYNFFLEKY